MHRTPTLVVLTLAAVAALCAAPRPAQAVGRTQLRNICHIKGQEENTLRGMGLVVGLNGTGEAGDPITMRKLSRAMEIMGTPASLTGPADEASLAQLKDIKNVALVMVTATVPATGARSGDKLTCYVSAINGKSLEGGRLAFASLMGPNTQHRQVYGICEGQLVVDNPEQPMVARVHEGCQMIQDVRTPFHSEDGYITLVLDHNHADFIVAESVGAAITQIYVDQYVPTDASEDYVSTHLVQVMDARNIRVKIPEPYHSNPVGFASQLLEVDIYNAEPEARVTVNPRSGSIVISGDIEIGDVVVTHRNLVVEATAPPALLAPVDPGEANKPKLDRLVQALGSLKVPPDDIIEIIRGIERCGKLHGKLVVE